MAAPEEQAPLQEEEEPLDPVLEMQLCARYGELEDLVAWLDQHGVDVNAADDLGNSALHLAAANGHLDCVQALMERGAHFKANDSGNTPLHWAITNKAVDMVRLLLDGFEQVDVLATNSFGKSCVSEAFNVEDKDVLQMVLEHPSAKQLEKKGGQPDAAVQGASGEGTETEVDPNVVQKYEHVMCFKPDTPPLHVDEIATSWFGKVFDKRAEDDTTGIQIWAASLVMAYWIVDLAPELDGKRVCELGAGCGLPALATLAYSDAKQVVMTDVFEPTLENLRANVKRNGDNNSMASRAAVHCLDWTKPETYRIDPDVAVDQQFDVLLGCDLIYDNALVQPLINTIRALLPVGGTFYYVSGGKRQGARELVQELRTTPGLTCEMHQRPDSYKSNPLVGKTEAELELHFNELFDNNQVGNSGQREEGLARLE